MSVFSKIFIVINLLLTLLLVAATATQISLKGVYKKQYKQNHDDWRGVKEKLAETKSLYEAQVRELRGQASRHKVRLTKAIEKRTAAASVAKDKANKKQELKGEKARLDGELKRINLEYNSKAAQITRDRDLLRDARKERARLWGRVQRLVQTWYALMQDLVDKQARDATKRGK